MDGTDCFADMFDQLHDFVGKGLFTDVTFFVGDSTIVKAHRVVLASCSSVLQELLADQPEVSSSSCCQSCYPFSRTATSHLEELYSHTIFVRDVDEMAFVAFIDYIYLRDVKIVKRHTKSMMMLAHKYKMEQLAALCDSFVEGSLDIDNAIEYLLLADVYGRLDLKRTVKCFIKSELDTIMASESWQRVEDKFDLMTEIIEWDLTENNMKRGHMDEVTWTLHCDGWRTLEKESILADRGEMMISPVICGEPKIGIIVSFYCRNGLFTLVGNLDHEYTEPVQLTFVATVTELLTSSVSMEKKVNLEWSSEEKFDKEIMTIAETVDIKFQYPVTVKVKVIKTPVHRSPSLMRIKEIDLRFSDAIIVVDNARFNLHKIVLATKCKFFSKLFEKDLSVRVYTVDNMMADTFECLVNYIYSSYYPRSAQVNLELLNGASRFELKELTEYCITVLIIHIGIENVIEVCINAELMCFEQLKSAAVEFIADNRDKLVKSKKWCNMKNHPHLLKEILKKISR